MRRVRVRRRNEQARMTKAIFLLAMSAIAVLVQLSSPNILAKHHSKAMDIFVFSVLISFSTAIGSMMLRRRRLPKLARVSGRLAVLSAAVAFSSATSMVLPHRVWWAAYIACGLPLFNLFPRPFVLCLKFLGSSLCWLKQKIAALWHEILQSLRASSSPETQNQDEMLEV